MTAAWGSAWQQLFQPDGIAALETALGLPADGVFDEDLDRRIKGHQALIGQTPGVLNDPYQYDALVGHLNRRYQGMQAATDPTPMQDTAYQQFMRNAGAEEARILDEIRYRTEQNTREINRRAAGFQADRAETNQNLDREQNDGRRRIQQDWSGRGFVSGGTSGEVNQAQDLTSAIGQKRAQMLGAIDQSQLEFEAGQNDSLSQARRALQGDAQALYRKRADEELAARDRIGRQAAEATYGG